MILPEKGLIVSCYLHSMKGSEERLIETLWESPLVHTLRIEGASNIALASKLKDIKDKYVIGLIKSVVSAPDTERYITHTVSQVQQVADAGADMVAIDSRVLTDRSIATLVNLYDAATLPIMADIETYSEGIIADAMGAEIISTTFSKIGYSVTKQLVSEGFKVNLEGGLTSRTEIAAAKEAGATWFTIGRAIHDPLTIIDKLVVS